MTRVIMGPRSSWGASLDWRRWCDGPCRAGMGCWWPVCGGVVYWYAGWTRVDRGRLNRSGVTIYYNYLPLTRLTPRAGGGEIAASKHKRPPGARMANMVKSERGGDTRSAWVAHEWLTQGQGGQRGGMAPSRHQRPEVRGVRRLGDWVMLALLVVVWVGVATSPLWMG